MNNASNILNFDFNFAHLQSTAKNIFESETDRRLKRNIGVLLEVITKNTYTSLGESNFDVRKIYDLFIENHSQGLKLLSEIFDSKLKVRRLCASLNYPENSKNNIIRSDIFYMAFHLLKEKFRYNWTFPLLDSLYKNWIGISFDNKKMVLDYLNENIPKYEGRNRFLNYLKTNAKLFLDDDSPRFMASNLLYNNFKLTNVIQIYNLPQHWIKTDFFGVLADYYTTSILHKPSDSTEFYINDIISFLNDHQNSDTTKKCVASIISKIENNKDDSLKAEIRTYSLKTIGDPTDSYKWKLNRGNAEEEERIGHARRILNEWINKEIIELFFLKVSMDTDRKEFWLQYYKYATKFKVFGNQSLLQLLQRDERISPILKDRFGHLLSAGSNNALVFIIKDYLFVEFSTKGTAFYAYKLNSKICPDINKLRLFKYDLIQPINMEFFLRKTGSQIWDTKPEGRFSHFEGWQPILTKWIRKYLRI